ncbi:MAG: hypothetical protein PHH58_08455 [Rhodoferax sp.]|nr:hypothetical protein [Rhodoferax sp.]
MPANNLKQQHDHSNAPAHAPLRSSVLAWPAWRRVLVVLPLVVALWLAVAWAQGGLARW